MADQILSWSDILSDHFQKSHKNNYFWEDNLFIKDTPLPAILLVTKFDERSKESQSIFEEQLIIGSPGKLSILHNNCFEFREMMTIILPEKEITAPKKSFDLDIRK